MNKGKDIYLGEGNYSSLIQVHGIHHALTIAGKMKQLDELPQLKVIILEVQTQIF